MGHHTTCQSASAPELHRWFSLPVYGTKGGQRDLERWNQIQRVYQAKQILSRGLLPKQRNGPGVVHGCSRVQCHGMRDPRCGIEEGVEKSASFVARRGERM